MSLGGVIGRSLIECQNNAIFRSVNQPKGIFFSFTNITLQFDVIRPRLWSAIPHLKWQVWEVTPTADL